MKERMLLIIIAVFILLGVIMQFVALSTSFSGNNSDRQLMILNISGGFAAMQIEVKYHTDGLVFYNNSKTNFERSVQIQQPILKELLNRVDVLIRNYQQGLVLEAEPGSADYFIYNLRIYRDGKIFVYQWTDTSKSPPTLRSLATFISQVNNLVVKGDSVIFYIKSDNLNYKEGETLLFRIIALNPTTTDFYYQSPTPCTPNFKLTIIGPDDKEVELYPIGSEVGRSCIQIIQGRTLGSGFQIQSEYEYTLRIKGSYIIQASFPYSDISGSKWQDEIIVSCT
jgi:hypothetical protein